MKNCKFSPKIWAIGLGVVWITLIIGGGLFLMFKKEQAYVAPKEWAVYQDENVQFKHPKDWVISEVPKKFRKLVNFEGDCRGIVFQDKKHPEVVLIMGNFPEPLQNMTPCWISYKEMSRLFDLVNSVQGAGDEREKMADLLFPKPRQVKIDGKETEVRSFMYGSKNNLIGMHTFQSDFSTNNFYQFSGLYPRKLSIQVEPILDEIFTSFKYLKKYHPSFVKPVEWKTFSSKTLGFSFGYPADWGTVKEEISDNKGHDGSVSGKAYSLLFSYKSTIPYLSRAGAIGESFDHPRPMEGGDTGYRGDVSKLAGVSSEINFTKESIVVSGLCYEAGYPSGQHLGGIIKFNLPKKEISGVMFKMPILSPSDIEKYNKIVDDFMKKEINCMDTWGDNQESGKAKQVYKKLQAKEKEISEMLKAGVNFDEESKLNLKIYQHILESAKVF